MANVDPFVHRLPRALVNDPEARQYFEYLNQVIHDLWVRTGGSADLVGSTASASSTNFYAGSIVSDDAPRVSFEVPPWQNNGQAVFCQPERNELNNELYRRYAMVMG